MVVCTIAKYKISTPHFEEIAIELFCTFTFSFERLTLVLELLNGARVERKCYEKLKTT